MGTIYRNQCGNRGQSGRIFTANFAVPYIYLPSGSAFAAASRLLIDCFQQFCSAIDPSTAASEADGIRTGFQPRVDHARRTRDADNSSKPRRAIDVRTLIAVLQAPKSILAALLRRTGSMSPLTARSVIPHHTPSKPLREGLGEGFAEPFPQPFHHATQWVPVWARDQQT